MTAPVIYVGVCIFAEEELELGMSFATMDALMEREQRAWDLEEDLAHEHELGRAWLLGESECPWPWYADKPYVICRPQVFKR